MPLATIHGMSTRTFDTLDAIHRLRDAGFDETQAVTIVRVLSDAPLVTTDDLRFEISALRLEIQSMELRFTIKLSAFLSIAIVILIAVLRASP